MQIKIAINSTIKRFDKTKDIIIPSLIKSGVLVDDIYYFLSQSDKNQIYKDNKYNINIVEFDYNSYDFNALIAIVDLELESDYWFYLHDISYVTDYFYNKIKNFENLETFDVIQATTVGTSMNFGLYKYKFLLKLKKALLNYKNYDFSEERMQHMKFMAVHYENILFEIDKINYFLNKNNQNDIFDIKDLKISSFSDKHVIGDPFNQGPQEYYNNGVKRLLFFYEDLGIYKYGANYSDWRTVKKWITEL